MCRSQLFSALCSLKFPAIFWISNTMQKGRHATKIKRLAQQKVKRLSLEADHHLLSANTFDLTQIMFPKKKSSAKSAACVLQWHWLRRPWKRACTACQRIHPAHKDAPTAVDYFASSFTSIMQTQWNEWKTLYYLSAKTILQILQRLF